MSSDQLSTSELKQLLTSLRIRHDHCLDRNELLDLYNAKASPGALAAEASKARKRHDANKSGEATTSHNQSNSRSKDNSINWQTVILSLICAYFLYNKFLSPVGDIDSGQKFSASDTSYLQGNVIDIETQDDFLEALKLHKEDSGLPVVVDFFSHGCGPCRMIAPTYTKLAKEYAGRAVFLKVDIDRNRETASHCRINSMPTFHFYHNEKKVHQFSGADSNQLREYTRKWSEIASREGVYAGLVVTASSLRDFFTTHDAKRLSEVDSILEKYGSKTAGLIKRLKKKYGAAPVAVKQRHIPEASVKPPSGEGKDRNAERVFHPAEPVPSQGGYSEETIAQMFISSQEYARSNPKSAPEKVVIVGGGPAGLSAAIYAARAGLSPLVISPFIGGQLLGKGAEVYYYYCIICCCLFC
jgi:thioredoxin 1